MTDGLAASGALVFCAAFYATLAAGREQRAQVAVHGLLLMTGAFLVCGLRVEKWLILVATTAATLITWFVARRSTHRRLAIVGLLVLAAVGLARGLQARYQTVSDDWWTVKESTLHFRLVHRNLTRIYDRLPAETQAILPREDAAAYDRDINQVRAVVNRATQGDEELRQQLTKQLVLTSVRHLWPSLIADIGHDFVTNLLSTYSFWMQVAMRELWLIDGFRELPGAEFLRRLLPPDTAYWNFSRLTSHHRRWIAVHLLLSWSLIAGATTLTAITILRRLRRRPRSFSWSVMSPRGDQGGGSMLPWTPALWLWFFNAAAFASSVNISNFRYMIFSHLLILGLVLHFSFGKSPDQERPSS